MNYFYQQLNASPWKGIISEVGLGIEFTAGLLRNPGASKTLLYFTCDYAGLDRVHGERAVSLENACRVATANYERAIKTAVENEPIHNFFGLAVTGAHYTDRESHGWIALKTQNDLAYMHFIIPQNADRSIVGEWSANVIAWFLTGCFLKQTTWADHIIDYSLPCTIDVIYAAGISDVERLLFLGPNNLLAFKNGKFIRVADALRQTDVIYSGSFNPPTVRHGAQDHCLFEISQEHTYKGTISIQDLLHRIRMLDLMHKTVLISRSARFIDKHRVLRTYHDQDYIFLVGADAWNATIARHQYPSDDFLEKALGNTKFVVMPRKGYSIEKNALSAKINVIEMADDNKWPAEVSSTTVRNSEDPAKSGWITHPVSEYIRVNKLYVK